MEILRLIAPFYVTYTCVEILSGAMRGSGESVAPTLITLGGICVLRLVWLLGFVARQPSVPLTMVSYPMTWFITSCLFVLSLYELARDYVLPTAVEFAPKRDQAQYRTIVQALPNAELASAIAGAYWARADGAHRFLLRVTAEELRNYGAVYNVISAALLVNQKDDD